MTRRRRRPQRWCVTVRIPSHPEPVRIQVHAASEAEAHERADHIAALMVDDWDTIAQAWGLRREEEVEEEVPA